MDGIRGWLVWKDGRKTLTPFVGGNRIHYPHRDGAKHLETIFEIDPHTCEAKDWFYLETETIDVTELMIKAADDMPGIRSLVVRCQVQEERMSDQDDKAHRCTTPSPAEREFYAEQKRNLDAIAALIVRWPAYRLHFAYGLLGTTVAFCDSMGLDVEAFLVALRKKEPKPPVLVPPEEVHS